MTRWDTLGATRFFLAMIVAGSHLTMFDTASPFCALGTFSGLVAVIGFLMISGYSIAHSVTRNPEGFYRRRIMRIMPTYLFCLGIACVLGALGLAAFGRFLHPPAAHEVIENAFFLQLFTGHSLSNNPVVWSLAVEVAFYLLAPLLRRIEPWIIVAATLISAIAYVIFLRRGGVFFAGVGYGQNIGLLAWPWLLGFWFYGHRHSRLAAAYLMILPLVALYASHETYLRPTWWLTIIITAAAMSAPGLIKLPKAFGQFADFLGELSYPLYLIHVPTLLVISKIAPDFGGVFYISIAWIAAAATYIFVDRPFRTAARRESKITSVAHPI